MLRMEACIAEIKSWMAINYLKLNDDKTEFIMFGTPKALQSVSECTVSVGDVEVKPSKTVRNIGAMMDSALTMKSHVNYVIKSCYAQLRNLSRIRKYLIEKTAKSLIHAFVCSCLDMMNSILVNVPGNSLIKRLQLIQNHAARIVKIEKKHAHITPHLIDLHWLPIEYRIQFKILLLVYKSMHGKGPAYLASMLEEYRPSRSLRSAGQSRLVEPRTYKKYGERAFSVAGPKLWNDLRDDIKFSETVDSFKSRLKTYLFIKAYGVQE